MSELSFDIAFKKHRNKQLDIAREKIKPENKGRKKKNFCFSCKSTTSKVMYPKSGKRPYVRWYKIKEGHLCYRCYFSKQQNE